MVEARGKRYRVRGDGAVYLPSGEQKREIKKKGGGKEIDDEARIAWETFGKNPSILG